MKQQPLVIALVSTALSLGLAVGDAQAKRLSSGGMQRSVPSQPMQRQTPPPSPAQPVPQQAAQQQAQKSAVPAPAPVQPAPAKRSWLGPVAGLAAGLGLAALASHFGFGAELGNFMTLLLLGVVAMMLVRWLMRRFAGAPAQAPQGMQYAGGMGDAAAQPVGGSPGSGMPAPSTAASAAPVAAAPVPSADAFDIQGFEQIAKRVFIRLQAANDARDQDDLRRFTTPEMYAVIQQELLERKGEQRTDVLQLRAQVIERAEEEGRQIVSVRFGGLIREQSEAAAEPFDEIWHLVRPADGSRDWAIAGIQAVA